MKNTDLTVAQALVDYLIELNISHVFGVSGANVEHFHDAIFSRAQGKIDSILCKTEIGAAFMADSYSRHATQDKPEIGVCCATSGGGMMNLNVGIAESRTSGIPVLGIIGCPTSTSKGVGAFQDASGGVNRVDAVAMCKAVAKTALRVRSNTFWKQLKEALHAAMSGFQGPALLLISRDVMQEIVPPKPKDMPTSLAEFRQISIPNESLYEALVNDIRSAKAPLIIAGPDVAKNKDLEMLSTICNIPLATTLESSTAISQSHLNYIGIAGVAGHEACHEAIEKSDLIISMGSQLDLMTRAPIEKYLDDKKVWLLHTNVDSAPAYSQLQSLVCNAYEMATRLLNLGKEEKWNFKQQKVKEIVYFDPPTVAKCDKFDTHMSNSMALQAIQPHLDHFHHVFMDAGNCAASAAHYLKIPKDARASIALGMGGMGYAICAAIGDQLARPERPSMVVCGDGAFLMTGLEIHTAVENKLPILWIVFNDSQHGMCTTRQRFMFDSRINSTQYSRVNFSSLSQALGSEDTIWTSQAHNQDEIETAIKEFINKDTQGPGVLELVINQEEIPPFFPLTQLA